MALSFFAPNRTVLLIADDALYVYATGASGVRLVEVVSWETENFETNVAGIIAKDCGGKPVLILNDMVEQHYRKERILRKGVNIMDKSSMVRRKLMVAFPNYPIRAAYALKEKAPKAGKRGAAEIYIFAAIAETKQYTRTIAAVNQSLASIAGFCLLPVESSDMVKALQAKIASKGQQKSQWVLFMGQHRHGGLRQIVIKNGELALTRITPVMDSDQDAGAWAGEVYQEFNATMSYLSRFGFQPEDGLHIITVANNSGGEALQSMIDDGYTFTSMTSAEAARALNLPLGAQDDYRYADCLHAAWAGRKSKFILPMKSQKIDNVSKPRRIAMAASLLLFLGASFLMYQLIMQGSAMSSVNSDLEDGKARLAQLKVQYEKEVKRKEDLGFDVRLVQSSISVYDGLEKAALKPLPFYRDVGRALGRDMRVDRIALGDLKGLPSMDMAGVGKLLSRAAFEAKMQMTYPSTTDVDKGNKEVDDLRDRLRATLKDHTVEVTKRLKDYEYVQEIVVETGDLKKKNVTQDFVAEITIKGPPLP